MESLLLHWWNVNDSRDDISTFNDEGRMTIALRSLTRDKKLRVLCCLVFLINLSMTCRKSFYAAFFWFAFITKRRKRWRRSGNFLPWWKNWLRGTCFPLHSLITRHSKTCGSVITYELSGTSASRRPLNNDVSFSISSAGWSGYGRKKEKLQQCGNRRKHITNLYF